MNNHLGVDACQSLLLDFLLLYLTTLSPLVYIRKLHLLNWFFSSSNPKTRSSQEHLPALPTPHTPQNSPHHQPTYPSTLPKCLMDSPPSDMTPQLPLATSSWPARLPQEHHHPTQTQRSKVLRLPSSPKTSTRRSEVCDYLWRFRWEAWLMIE